MMTTNRTSFVLLTIVAMGCNYETSDPNSDDCTEIPGIENCGGDTGGDTGNEGESGETGADEPTEFPNGNCRHNLDPDHPLDYGWRFQCEGHLYVSIDFDAPLNNDCDSLFGPRCHEHHIFGPSNDTYESPDVMACCGQYDPAAKETYFQYCDYDIIQQTCVSMAKRLEKMVMDGTFGVYAGQGAKLQQWVALNYETCFQQFLINDSAPEFGKLTSSWSIPNNPEWPDLQNFVITIDDGTVVTGVMQPSDPADWLSCQSALDNNDEIFEDSTPPNGGVVHGVLLDNQLNASMIGPELFGGRVTASLDFGPACAAKGCSSAAFWQDTTGSKLVLQDLTLFTDPFSVSNGNGMSMLVDSARIALYEHAPTTKRYAADGEFEGYVVQPGDGFFLFSGAAADNHDHYLARNADELVISQVDGFWQIAPFVLEYVDENGHTWSASLGASRWR